MSWRDKSLCAEIGADFWFPEQGESSRYAKETCARCPVQMECLAWALENNEQYGIYGGLSERQRRALRKKENAA